MEKKNWTLIRFWPHWALLKWNKYFFFPFLSKMIYSQCKISTSLLNCTYFISKNTFCFIFVHKICIKDLNFIGCKPKANIWIWKPQSKFKILRLIRIRSIWNDSHFEKDRNRRPVNKFGVKGVSTAVVLMAVIGLLSYTITETSDVYRVVHWDRWTR